MLKSLFKKVSASADLPETQAKGPADLKRAQRFSSFWRAMSLGQLPLTTIALIVMLSTYFHADTIIHVADPLEPGLSYPIEDLPDKECINVAMQFIGLTTTYQQYTARDQFELAQKLLVEPALSEFIQKMMGEELTTIEQTGRSQMFFAEPRQMKVDRVPNSTKVVVRLPGYRQQIVNQNVLPPAEVVYYVELMTTDQAVQHNQFGIVVSGFHERFVALSEIAAQDRSAAKKAKNAKKDKSSKKKPKKLLAAENKS